MRYIYVSQEYQHKYIMCNSNLEVHRCSGCNANTRFLLHKVGGLSSLRVFAIQTKNIFIRGSYLKYLDFLSQDICFLLGLNSAISSQACAREAASVKAELRIYPGTLQFEPQDSLRF